MLKIKFYEAFEEEEALLRSLLPGHISADYTPQTIQESSDREPVSEVACIRTQSIIPAEWGGKINGLLTRSQGFNHLEEYKKTNKFSLPCGYLGDYCSVAVAEHAIMVSAALLKKFKPQLSQFKSFQRDGLTGRQWKDKNALVIGVGKIGVRIAGLAKALGMNVKGVDIVKRFNDVSYISLSEGINWADIVFCAAILTDDTKRMLTYELFSQTKKRPILVNVSRGEITPLNDMKRLLDEGVLGGLGLDVFEGEEDLACGLRNKREGSPCFDLSLRDNVVFTPHNAFNTSEALQVKVEKTIDSIKRFVETGSFPDQI